MGGARVLNFWMTSRRPVKSAPEIIGTNYFANPLHRTKTEHAIIEGPRVTNDTLDLKQAKVLLDELAL
jgi:hypothetical protein